MVGKTGFEPATLCSQSRCATKLRYFPIVLGAPDMSRTRNLQIRSLTLYPIELRAQVFTTHLNPVGGSYRNRTDGD